MTDNIKKISRLRLTYLHDRLCRFVGSRGSQHLKKCYLECPRLIYEPQTKELYCLEQRMRTVISYGEFLHEKARFVRVQGDGQMVLRVD